MITYRQIEQIENFIKEEQQLEDRNGLTNEKWLAQAKSLDERIIASGIGYKKDAIDWGKCSVFLFDDGVKYYPDDILSNLTIIRSALQGILDGISYYPYILEVRKDIEQGKKVGKSGKRKFITEMLVKYQGKIDFGKAVQEYLRQEDILSLNDDKTAYFNGVLQKLEFYLLEVCEEKKVARTQSQPKQNIFNIQQSQNVSQETNVNVEISFEDCFKALDDCETLDDTETQEIKAQLEEIEELLKDKKGKKKEIGKKIGEILKWLGGKCTDVMIAVLPMLLQNLQGLQ